MAYFYNKLILHQFISAISWYNYKTWIVIHSKNYCSSSKCRTTL